MANEIKIEINDKELNEKLSQLAKKTSNLNPIMKRISGIMFASVMQNFEQEGRPNKWAELSDFTKQQRDNMGYTNGQILQRSGSLKNSITEKSDDNSATVGTNSIYAKLMHFGGTVKPKNKKYLYLPTGAKKKGASKFNLLRQVKIPARPFMVLTDGDKKIILKVLKDELEV